MENTFKDLLEYDLELAILTSLPRALFLILLYQLLNIIIKD